MLYVIYIVKFRLNPSYQDRRGGGRREANPIGVGYGYPGSVPKSQGSIFLQAMGRGPEETRRADTWRQNVGWDACKDEFSEGV